MANYEFSLTPKIVPKVKTKNRQINSAIPAPGTREVIERLSKYESRSMHGQLPIVWKSAKDFNVYDIAGNCWIDFTSTIFVANVGHSNPKVTSAIQDSLNDPIYSCYAYANNTRAQYLEKLIEFSGPPFEKAFLLSAGTETTEAALKLMRMYGQKKAKKRLGIICIEGNWHGRTQGAQMMSSNHEQKKWIGFEDSDIHHIPFPYPWKLNGKNPQKFLMESLLKLSKKGINIEEDICGFMLETFQGWGAVFYPKDYVKAIENICRKNDILLTFDEMQSGFGRTGKKFGFIHYDVSPDLICCGKGMGGGIPLSGVLGRADIMDLPKVGNMSSTHSANPMVCAAGMAVIKELEDKNLIEEAERKGKLMLKKLNELKKRFPDRVLHINAVGLVAAVLFKNPQTNKVDTFFPSKVAELCMQKGLLVVHTGRESIKIGPPLTITDDALIEGIDVLEESISELVFR